MSEHAKVHVFSCVVLPLQLHVSHHNMLGLCVFVIIVAISMEDKIT